MAKIDVDALLGDIMGALDKGVKPADVQSAVKKEKRAKKGKTLTEESVQVFRFHKPSMTTEAVVLMVTRHTCSCCGDVKYAENKHLFAKKKDKHGNLHYTRYLQEEDCKDAIRLVEYRDVEVAVCMECFTTEELKPVLSEEAFNSIHPVEEQVMEDKSSKELREEQERVYKEAVQEAERLEGKYVLDEDVPTFEDLEELVFGGLDEDE